MTAPDAPQAPAISYERPTISASRLKAIGGEKGEPGCERKLAAHYLFDMRQSGSDATAFGSALHAMAEHHQATAAAGAPEILDPEGAVARVYTAGAHLVTLCGHLLVEHEHIGELPDGTPYVAYIDGHSPRVSGTNTLVIQDLKTTSNANFALQGDEDGDSGPPDLTQATARAGGPYALREDLQAIFYAWILLVAPPHWFAPRLPDGVMGPRHWQWWDPAARGVGARTTARLRWVYFLTRGVPRAWEANDWMTPAAAVAALEARVMPLVAKINALHQWHHGRVTGVIPGGPPRLDEIDRTLDACRDRRRGTYGRWCGAGERDACSFDQIGTPVLDLVQLRIRKTMTPQERLAQIKNRQSGGVAAAVAAPAPQEAPAANPPPVAPQEAPAANPPPVAEPAPTTAPEPQPAPTASPVAASSAPETTGPSPAAELTRGQKAAATRAAKKAAAGASATPPASPPIVGNINPPEALEALAKLAENPVGRAAPPADEKLTAPLPHPAPVSPIQAAADLDQAVHSLTTEEIVGFLISRGYTVSLQRGAR